MSLAVQVLGHKTKMLRDYKNYQHLSSGIKKVQQFQSTFKKKIKKQNKNDFQNKVKSIASKSSVSPVNPL